MFQSKLRPVERLWFSRLGKWDVTLPLPAHYSDVVLPSEVTTNRYRIDLFEKGLYEFTKPRHTGRM